MMLLVGQQEGHQARKTSAATFPNSVLLGSSITWNDSGKLGWLNKTVPCVLLLLFY